MVTNTFLTASVIAKEALRLLENNLVFANLVHRGFEKEWEGNVNGYKKGDTVSVEKPIRYTVRTGEVASPQDSQSGKTSITVDQFEGVDLQFSSKDMTLNVSNFSDKYLKTAMMQLANSVDMKIAGLYNTVWNWVSGTYMAPTTTPMAAFADFTKAPQRLDEMSVPAGERAGVLSPADTYGLVNNFTGLFINDTAKKALEKAKLPVIANCDPYSSLSMPTHTVGTKAGTPLVNGAAQVSTWATVKDTNTQNLISDGWTASSAILKKGDIITIAGVFAVNPVNKLPLPYLQQFVVNANLSADGTGNATPSISPAIIVSGAYQNVSAAPADNAAMTVAGTASTGYQQNLVFHPSAFSLVMVPLELPEGAVKPARESYKGLSCRLIPYYDGANNLSNWRFDILYGVKAIYPDLATRVNK